jgi:hypothetical protein
MPSSFAVCNQKASALPMAFSASVPVRHAARELGNFDNEGVISLAPPDDHFVTRYHTPSSVFSSSSEIVAAFFSSATAARRSTRSCASARSCWSATNSSYGRMTNSFTPFFFRTSGWSLIIGLTISLAAMNNTINNNRVALTDPQAILRCPVRELFHIASQLVCHGFDFLENTSHLLMW